MDIPMIFKYLFMGLASIVLMVSSIAMLLLMLNLSSHRNDEDK